MLKKTPLILASGSQARKMMLENAGLSFDVKPANIDEQAIKNKISLQNTNFSKVPLKLSKEKSIKISQQNLDHYVIGSDQVLVFNNKIYDKAKNISEAKERLLQLQGKTHRLISAVCIYKGGDPVWEHVDTAHLHMRSLTSAQIDDYIEAAGDVVTSCVGCYALEGVGIQLFSEIDGDYFTILGMPFLPLLNYLYDLNRSNS